MSRFILPVILLLLSLLITSGCAVQRLSKADFEEAKTEVIQGDYNEVFTSAVTALRDKGFHVNVIDRSKGTISASFRFAPNRELDGEFFEGYRPRFAFAMRADARIKPVDANQTFVDIPFVEELPPPSTTYTLRPEDLTYREVRTGQQYDVFFSKVRSILETKGP